MAAPSEQAKNPAQATAERNAADTEFRQQLYAFLNSDYSDGIDIYRPQLDSINMVTAETALREGFELAPKADRFTTTEYAYFLMLRIQYEEKGYEVRFVKLYPREVFPRGLGMMDLPFKSLVLIKKKPPVVEN